MKEKVKISKKQQPILFLLRLSFLHLPPSSSTATERFKITTILMFHLFSILILIFHLCSPVLEPNLHLLLRHIQLAGW